MKRFLFHAMLSTALVALWAALGNFSEAQEGPPAARSAAQPGNQEAAESDSTPEALEQRLAQLALELKELPKLEITTEALPPSVARNRPPELRDSKFAATVHLESGRGMSFSSINQLPVHARTQLTEVLRGLPKWNWSGRNASEHFKNMVDQTPEKLLPEKSVIEFLTSASADREIQYQGQLTGSGAPMLHYTIFAPTAEEAERRARAIIQLCDAGYSRPIQRQLLEKGQAALAGARSKSADLPKIAAAIAAQDATLAKPSEITPDILSQLKAQKVMVAVELAGLNARVKACDAMLTEPRKLEISTLQSISDMKVKAEIERVGIKDKLEQINTFIQEGDQRAALQMQRQELAVKRDALQAEIRSQLIVARALAEFVGQYSFDVKQLSVGPIASQTE
jgi:hypothetical protein